MNLEQLQREERELEEKMFGAPEGTETKEPEATGVQAEQNGAPTDNEGLVAQSQQSATDEQLATTREPEEDWEKRFKNLRASRDNKLQEATSRLSVALSTLKDLQQENDELREELATARASKDPFDGAFTPEEAEVVGDDAMNIIKKAAQRASDAATADLQKQLKEQKELRRKEQEAQVKSAQEGEYDVFISRLARMVPEWQTLNSDKDFIGFCHETLDIDGTLIADNFAAAEARRDANTIARYMLEFKRSKQSGVTKVNPLEEHVAPTGSGGSDAVNTKETVSGFTRAEIDKFYDDLARGVYKGRKAEADKIEAEIDEAVMAGNIR